jgi:hypothetical protein
MELSSRLLSLSMLCSLCKLELIEAKVDADEACLRLDGDASSWRGSVCSGCNEERECVCVYIAVLSTPGRKHGRLPRSLTRLVATLPVIRTRQVMRTLVPTRQVAGLIILQTRDRDDAKTATSIL